MSQTAEVRVIPAIIGHHARLAAGLSHRET
jgi:hypothetical protein